MIKDFFEGLLFFVLEVMNALLRNFLPAGTFKRKDIAGQVVVVTGAGNGLGRLTARKLAGPGVHLALWDIDDKALEDSKAECEKNGAEAKVFHVDMSSREAIYEGAQKTLEAFGRVDIVVNNAGIAFGKPFLTTTDNQNQKLIEVNFLAHIWMAKAFLPAMVERDSGHLVTIASMAGIIGAPYLVDYCASKFGAVGFQEALENEMAALGKFGIKFTTVCPSFIATKLMDNLPHAKGPTNMCPDYVTDEIVDAVLTEKRILLLPKKAYFLYALKGFLPRSVIQRVLLRELPH